MKEYLPLIAITGFCIVSPIFTLLLGRITKAAAAHLPPEKWGD